MPDTPDGPTRIGLPLVRDEALEVLQRVVGRGAEEVEPAGAPFPGTSQRLRVLLAEDHPVNRMVAVRMLEELGHEVVVAHDGQQAVERAEAGGLDLALIDIQMPRMDGMEALAAIRSRERDRGGARMPAIALTAHAMHEDRERCLRAGFDEHLSKPIRIEELLSILARFGPTSRNARGDKRQAGAADGRDIGSEILGLCEGDHVFMRELVTVFLQSAPATIERMEQAAVSGDAKALQSEAHALKGICLTIGASELAGHARQIEELARKGEDPGLDDLLTATRSCWEGLRAELLSLLDEPRAD